MPCQRTLTLPRFIPIAAAHATHDRTAHVGVAERSERSLRCTETRAWVQGEWLERASEVLNARIARHAAQEIRFNLMAIVRDPRAALRARVGDLQRRLQEEGTTLVEAERDEVLREKADVEAALGARERERERWRRENCRRKHDYVPLIFNLLQVMAERDELMPLLQKARAGKGPAGA